MLAFIYYQSYTYMNNRFGTYEIPFSNGVQVRGKLKVKKFFNKNQVDYCKK
jgi:hypothetical protein